jgi:hypothetical protein
MSTKRKLKKEAKRLKKEQNRKKPLKLMDALREIFVKPPPKKSKQPQPLERMSYMDFRGGGRKGP